MHGIQVGGKAALRKRFVNGVLIGVPFLGTSYTAVYFQQHRLNGVEISSFVLFYALTGISIGAGFHRCFSHRSFEAVPWLKFMLLFFGSLACQGSVVRWVADHRRHHRFSDAPWDVHSPYSREEYKIVSQTAGLFHAHLGWMFDRTTTDYRKYAPDALNDAMLLMFHRYYFFFIAFSLVLPFTYGCFLGGTETAIGCLLLGGFVRITVLQNIVWAVNSIGHSFGGRAQNSRDLSRNNALLALLTFGDGWHNNHHVAPRSAFNNWRWYQLDINGFLIACLESCGFVRSVVRGVRTERETVY